MVLAGMTSPSGDAGALPMMLFDVRRHTDNTLLTGVASIINRPLFSWCNYIITHMQMSANGNLGIGTQLPQAKLHTTGSIRFEGVPTIAGTYLLMAEIDGTVSKFTRPGNTLPALATVNTATNAVPKFNASGVMLNS